MEAWTLAFPQVFEKTRYAIAGSSAGPLVERSTNLLLYVFEGVRAAPLPMR